MTRPLLVLRPEPGNSRTVQAARALGMDPHALPLFGVAPMAWQPPVSYGYRALLLTSANAIRHAGEALARYRALPVLAVGPETAAAAQAAGFEIAETGTGNANKLLANQKGPLLHLCGADVTPVTSVAKIDRVIVYASVAQTPDNFAALTSAPAVALLHSARAAAHFASLATDRSQIAIAAFSPAVAQAAGDGWESLAIAANPRDEELLAIAKQLCGL
jgi:uroporphyrinogen-III synthase